MAEKTIWGVHMALEHGRAPLEQGYIAIGWHLMGDLSPIKPNRESFKTAYLGAYPESKPAAVRLEAGMLYRFIAEMKLGDIIIYPSKADKMVNIGVLDGEYEYHLGAPVNCPNWRKVKWRKSVPRASFSQSALREIGAAMTLFTVTSNADEFLAAMAGEQLEPDDIDEISADRVSHEVEETTEDFIIKRLKTSQTPNQFEHFVAHLLKCMGYFARVTKASGDGGIDIIAHRDELGFEPPIIKVQCKQVLSTIGRPEVQQLHGAVEHGEHGLFVTLGSYSTDARTFERTKPNLRLLDGEGLIELIYEHYHRFEPRYQMLLPLRRAYIPGPSASGGD
jgi:restriction system protein